MVAQDEILGPRFANDFKPLKGATELRGFLPPASRVWVSYFPHYPSVSHWATFFSPPSGVEQQTVDKVPEAAMKSTPPSPQFLQRLRRGPGGAGTVGGDELRRIDLHAVRGAFQCRFIKKLQKFR